MTGVIFLAAQETSVSEADGVVLVTFARTGDLSGAVNITYGITPDNATEGADYTGLGGVVLLPANAASVTVAIPILDDALGEPTETFVVSLIQIDSGTLEAPRTSRVSILDNEIVVIDPPEPPNVSNYNVSLVPVAEGLNVPIRMEFSKTDADIAYVALKGGMVKAYNINTWTEVATVLDISEKVNDFSDRGFMDVAFHPDLANNPYMYAFYVADPPEAVGQTGMAGENGGGNRYAHVVRYTLDASNNYLSIVPNSEVILIGGAGKSAADISGGGALDSNDPDNLSLVSSDVYINPNAAEPPVIIGGFKQDYIKLDSTTHAGGSLAFGPDGALYISIGDGTAFNFMDPRTLAAQNLNSLSGKILRVDAISGEGLTDNPFYEAGMSLDSNAAKVYQLGVRNPFSMNFSPDGRLFFTETGWNTFEEINTGQAGANFGWPFYEGGDSGVLRATGSYRDLSEAFAFYQAVADGDIVVTPAFRSFAHASAEPGYQFQAITGGGVFYTGDRYPVQFQNHFFFTDHSDAEIFSVDINNRQEIEFLFDMPPGFFGPVDYQQGADGYVYAVDIAYGRILRLLIEPKPVEASDFAVNGSAVVGALAGEYTLTNAGTQAGSVISTRRIDLREDFSISFDMLFGQSDDGADGTAFVLHNSAAAAAALGGTGGAQGAEGIANGLAIVFDTFANLAAGDLANDSARFLDTDSGVRTVPVDLGNIEDGLYHQIAVLWDAALSTLTFRLDGVTVGTLTDVNIGDTYFGGSEFVYFGFTGATGGLFNETAIRIDAVDAVFENNAPVAIADSFLVDADSLLVVGVASLTGNDTDVDGDALIVTAVGNATNGEVNLANGQVVFTPTPGYIGPASFGYTLSDGEGGFATGAVSLQVRVPPRFVFKTIGATTQGASDTEFTLTDAPGQAGAAMSMQRIDLRENFSIAFEMLFGQTDEGADGTSFVLHNDPRQESTIGGTGGAMGMGTITRGLAITFDTFPNPGATVPDDTTQFFDTDALTGVTPAINLGNIEDGAFHNIVVTWNAATSTLTYTLDGVVLGTLSDVNLSDTYFGGSDFVYFGFTSGTGGDFNETAVRVGAIDAVLEGESGNASPVAVNDALVTPTDTPLIVSAASLAANDTDANTDPLLVTAVSAPVNGVVNLANGQITFTPTAGFVGAASFQYTISDGNGGFDTGLVTVEVQGAGPPPFALNGSAAAAAGGFRLTDAGMQAGSVISTERIDLRQDFSISFNMLFGQTEDGADGATFVLHNDAAGAAALGGLGGAQGAQGIAAGLAIEFDTYTNVADGDPLSDNVRFMDTDTGVRTAPLNISNIEDGAYHAVVVTWNAATSTLNVTLDGVSVGTLTNANFATTYFGGSPFVHFGFTGGTGGLFNQTAVQVGVVDATFEFEAANADPVAVDDAFIAARDTALTLSAASLVANDTDIDSAALAVSAVGTAVNGAVTLSAGQITFTPTGGFVGAASFQYTVSDGEGGFDTGLVAIDVRAPTAFTFVANGTAAAGVGPSEFVLTDAPAETGTVMSAQRIDVSQDFVISFQMLFGQTDAGADGTSFILHNDPLGAAALGGGGWGQGAEGLANGLAIAFDTYSNAPRAEMANDNSSFLDTDSLVRTDYVDLGNVEDGLYHDIVVSWDVSTSTLTYSIDGVAIASLTDANFATTFFGGSNFVYFGFGASTGGLFNLTAIRIGEIDAVIEGGGPANSAPVAVDDAYTATEDTPFVVAAAELVANDTDADLDALTVTAVTNALNGAVSLAAGQITFTPTAGYTGPASFAYTIADGNGGFEVGTVNLTISPAPNTPPTAVADTNAGDPVVEAGAAGAGDPTAAGNVLANDTDPDVGDSATVVGVAVGTQAGPVTGGVGTTLVGVYGSLTLGADGAWSYALNNADPDTNALSGGVSADDVFTYTMADALGATSTSSIRINVTGANDGPIALADTNAGDAVIEAGVGQAGDPSASGNVRLNDSDPEDGYLVIGAAVSAQTGPLSGGLGTSLVGTYGSVTIDASGAWTYLLNNADPDTNALAAGATAQDVFSYTLAEGAGTGIGLTATTSLTINITGSNDAPTVAGETLAATRNTPLTVTAASLLANDSDVDGGVLTLSAVSAPVNGSVSLSAGQVTFTPTAGFVGVASFAYTVSDGNGGTTNATATVNVAAPASQAPVAVANTYNVNEDATLGTSSTRNLLSNDTDADTPASGLTAQLVTGSANGGTVTVNANGRFTYTPAANFNGVDTFTYRAFDGTQYSAPATVSITVNPRNDRPELTYNGGASTTINVNENAAYLVAQISAIDIDGDTPLTFSLSGPDAAFFTIDAGGALRLSARNFENPLDADGNNIYRVVVQVADPAGTNDQQTIDVRVQDVTEGAVRLGTPNADTNFRGTGDGDFMQAGAGADRVFGLGGNDTFIATIGDGDDVYTGGNGADTLDNSQIVQSVSVNLQAGTATGADIGADTLSGVENVIGGAGADFLVGSTAANRIEGGRGADSLTGGDGADTFVFRPGFGADQITDFADVAGNEDVLDFSAFNFASSAAVLGAATQVDANTIIDLGGGDQIVLINFDRTSLGAEDFIL